MKAKELKRKLDYVPRWLWYVGSLFVGFPFTTLALYLLFRALDRAILDEEETLKEQQQEILRQQRAGGDVSGEGYTVRTARPEQEYQRYRQTAHFEPIDPEAGVPEVLRQGRIAMRHIREANDAIPDPILSAKIDSIESSCGQILEMLEQRPELLPQLRTFLRYYLPTTLKLLDARARLDDAGTPKGREVRRRISNALGEVDKAFRNQIEALEEYRFVDLESEMDVLSQMLRSDGLISDEYEEKGQTMTSGGH